MDGKSSLIQKERAAAVNAGSVWSAHMSSLGIIFYYNSITRVSQWEKPRDFDANGNSPSNIHSIREKTLDELIDELWDVILEKNANGGHQAELTSSQQTNGQETEAEKKTQ